MQINPYKLLATRLDELPNGFPGTDDGVELRLLEKLFTPSEAELTAQLTDHFECIEHVATRTNNKVEVLRPMLKSLSRKGLIKIGKVDQGLGYKLMPFVVGIYEMQVGNMDAELAALVEAYFVKAFGEALRITPQFHRVIPIGESVRNSMEIHPFESASELINASKAWGVLDCICRKQKALIGEACVHPIDVCMTLSDRPGAFDNYQVVKAISREQALATLHRAADAGLVHSVSNSLEGVHYICNCCTCSCGILRGMKNLGIANVIARSAFVNDVDNVLCNSCGLCVDECMFTALKIGDSAVEVDKVRCVGCGVCVLTCPNDALGLVRRPKNELMQIPQNIEQWGADRLVARGR